MASAFELLKKPIFVALDLDDKTKIDRIVDETSDLGVGFKIGPRAVFRFGTEIIKDIAKKAPVFLDFKFYDIPSTMDSSVRAAFECGVSFATVHCVGGSEALKKLSETEKELSKIRPFSVLGVTILTSYSEKNLPPNFVDGSIESQVISLASIANENGIHGIVCSPHEVKSLKTKFPKCKFVTPGIRMPTDATNDQSRTATPQEALAWGASALVIGRSVLNAKSPREYLKIVLEQIGGVR